jgi:hypothetical protein
MTTYVRDLYATAANYTQSDRTYIDAHRFMYGALGEHVATAAILFRDWLMRSGFALPVIRLAPVAPYGHCMALSGNGGALAHAEARGLDHGIWLYLHEKFYGTERFAEEVDETVLHELLHNELHQFGENPKHKGAPWARRCQELSTRLGLPVQIERPRSIRTGGRVTTGTPVGCLSYDALTRWPHDLLTSGPSLRLRAQADAPLCSVVVDYTTAVAA